MHGSTGDIVLIGTQTPQLEEIFYDLTHKLDVDLGGSGSNLRTPAACLGQSRCEYACYNTQDACYQLTMDYQDELHRPAFPYKFKFKFDGCPNGCVAAMARSDFAVVGTWKDDIKIDQEAVKALRCRANSPPTPVLTPVVTGASSTSKPKSSTCAPPSA